MINYFRKRNLMDAVMGVAIMTLFVGGVLAAPALAQALDGGTHAAVMAPAPVPVPVMAPVATPTPVPIQEIVATVLTLAAFCLRRFAPSFTWMHTPAALGMVSTGVALLTGLAGAIAANGLSVRVVLVAVTAFMTSALSMANPSKPGVSNPEVLR